MKNALRIVGMLTIAVFLFSCGSPKQEKVELKMAAKEFHRTMENLESLLEQSNVTAAKDTLNVLQQKANALATAEIPAQLSTKSPKIQEQIASINSAIDTLAQLLNQTAADSIIMEKFSNLHMNFARLGALLRVKIPELTAFHSVLHVVWHTHYPNNDIEAIKSMVPQFKEKAAALDQIKWPPVLADKEADLTAKIKNLQQAVSSLDTACQGDDVEAIKKATAKIHDIYKSIIMEL